MVPERNSLYDLTYPPSPPPSPTSSTISEVTMSSVDSDSEPENKKQDHHLIEVTYMRPDELDSYMYQTVGHDVIHLYKDCLGLPLYRQEIKGHPIEQGSDYVVTSMDETEDLFNLLEKVKAIHPEMEAVSVGAILSTYQRIRVENVCARLGLVTLAYLWQRDQEELLNEMAQAGVNAILIKIAAIGLKTQHLGQSIGDMYSYLCKMNQQYDLHICGEGGEYETVTLDCPLFKRRIIVDESEIVMHSDDHFAQVAYLRFKRLHLEDKTEDELDSNWRDDMNLNPVWTADAMLAPIEKIVQSKLLLTNNGEDNGLKGIQTRKVTHNTSDSYPQVRQQNKSSTHQSKTVCAVGMTTAFENPPLKFEQRMSISEETTACLQNVQAKLQQIGLCWSEVVFMQVFVSDMGDFGVVNNAYKAFFGINPPPRACVGANLPNAIRIQVSCTAIRKEVSNPKVRNTLHVQGISYWAPANIGPYSQATQQAYHAYIAGQIGMIPCTLDLPEPLSLAKETAWSLRNLRQIATICQMDIVNRTALCIVYVKDSEAFAANNPAPLLAICMPSLPKGAQVEWQATLHDGNVYADKIQDLKEKTGDQDGYETDDDDVYQLEKRLLQPTTLSLLHKYPTSLDGTVVSEPQWEEKTQSWFLSPLLTALSVVHIHEGSTLASLMSSLSLSKEAGINNENVAISVETSIDMLTMAVKALDRILDNHAKPAAGPGVESGWQNVVAITLFYHEILIQEPDVLALKLESLLLKLGTSNSKEESSDQDRVIALQPESNSNIAVTLVPVQAIANNGVLALTLHAVGTMPTIPGLYQ
ncbi:ATP binding domain 4 [Haplosporangium sp. Z 27]|nr:ATP binding domain 4 [Haplosporangium sp. Z 27]